MRWLKALPVLLGPSCPSQSPCPVVALSHSGMGGQLGNDPRSWGRHTSAAARRLAIVLWSSETPVLDDVL